MRAFVCGCRGLALEAEERRFISQTQPFGLILFKRNVESVAQLSALTAEFRSIVSRPDAPVLIDQEGGRVQRLGPPVWEAYPAAARFDAELGPGAAEAAAWLTMRLIAHDLIACGINVDCAPVLDVADEATHAVIGSRAYGRDPLRVAALARAALRGLTEGGVLPVLKHIPGHGRARADSHLELPVVNASRAELERDFEAFRALADAPMAMTAHVVYTAIDPERAGTISPVVIGDIVRRDIGFQGLLFSDDLSMKALGGTFAERTRAAFAAGVDIALHCNGDLDEARAVADATPELEGAAADRARDALDAAAPPRSLDVDAARARLKAAFAKA